MKTAAYVLLCSAVLAAGCAPWKNSLQPNGGTREATANAIADFAHSHRLAKPGRIYSASLRDTSTQAICVGILEKQDKFYVYTNDGVGYYLQDIFPTSYLERNGAIFLWRDSARTVPANLLAKLSQLGRLDTVRKHLGEFPQYQIDDALKGTHYYFCPSDLRRYKKVTTSRAVGGYPPPKLDCGK
jgi:hypothetical protein